MAGGGLEKWKHDAVSGLVLVVAVAFGAKLAYGWLEPLLPAILTVLGLVVLWVGITRLRQR